MGANDTATLDENRSVIVVTGSDGTTIEVPWTFDTANAWGVPRPTSETHEANKALIARRVMVWGPGGMRMVDPATLSLPARNTRARRGKR